MYKELRTSNQREECTPGPPRNGGRVESKYISGYTTLSKGAVAQLGERLVCNQEVAGSIPVGSTRKALRIKKLRRA
jgi:hypothetical protein